MITLRLWILSAIGYWILALPALATMKQPDLAVPPEDARSWSILSVEGQHGARQVWYADDGTQWTRISILARGYIYDLDLAMTLNNKGIPTKIVVGGVAPGGSMSETFDIVNGIAKWRSSSDKGSSAWNDSLIYVPSIFMGLFSETFLVEALLRDENQQLSVLPSGKITLEALTAEDVAANGQIKTLRAFLLKGLSFSSSILWVDENDQFFALVGHPWLDLVPVGWEGIRPQLIDAQDAALAARAPAMVAEFVRDPQTPVLFENVSLYNAEASIFQNNMSVLVEGQRIKAVGSSRQIKAPKGAKIINGKGKTLVPGLWDMHAHLGDDDRGPTLLAQGVTSVRDLGSVPQTLLARKARIDAGKQMGPTIYPVLMIDGKGPLSSGSAIKIASLEEAIEAVQRAKHDGYVGIKLYGTTSPDWVAPMAKEAHRLGLSVQGHIPAGMRSSEAVAAGYDGINHINFVIMEAVPDEVNAVSNGLMRFLGPGQYAKDINLTDEPMASFIELLVKKQTVIDPTLSVYEMIFVPDPGEIHAAFAPYAGTLPSRVNRAIYAGGIKAPEGNSTTREDMRKSFDALVRLVGVLHKRGVPIVAGTDGFIGGDVELVRELELYIKADMTIAEALATATIVPARVLGVEENVGSIDVGKKADLLLVDGDVSENISLLRQVELVMQNGKIIDVEKLREAVGFTGQPIFMNQ